MRSIFNGHCSCIQVEHLSAASLRKKRTGYEEWQMLSGNSFVGTNELPTVRFKIDANYPIAAFMNIGFTHHYVIISKVKNVEQRKFYYAIL